VTPSPHPEPEPPAVDVDARGLRCPLPVIRLAEAARSAPDHSVIVVMATDPAARYDIPAWCRMRGGELIEVREMPAVRETAGVSDPADPVPTGSDRTGTARAVPAYIRFVVRVRH
jgi:tRNA 2-thiouridine synthesizing protein A